MATKVEIQTPDGNKYIWIAEDYLAQVIINAINANKYSLPKASASQLGGVKVGTNLSINNEGVLSATDTTYNNATTSANGLMSSTDKTKLDGLPSKNNSTTQFLRGDGTWQVPPDTKYTLPNATSSTLGGVKVGSNISVSGGTISLTKDNVTSALGTDVNFFPSGGSIGQILTCVPNAPYYTGVVYQWKNFFTTIVHSNINLNDLKASGVYDIKSPTNSPVDQYNDSTRTLQVKVMVLGDDFIWGTTGSRYFHGIQILSASCNTFEGALLGTLYCRGLWDRTEWGPWKRMTYEEIS